MEISKASVNSEAGLYKNDSFIPWNDLINLRVIVVSHNILTYASHTLCGTLVIDSSVKEIGDGSFINCDKLEALVFSNSLTSVGWGAFSKCINLEKILIPDGCKIQRMELIPTKD